MKLFPLTMMKLALFSSMIFTSFSVVDRCCSRKTVGGISYSLIGDQDTSQFGCISQCVYGKDEDSTGNKYCFKSGTLEVVCGIRKDITIITEFFKFRL